MINVSHLSKNFMIRRKKEGPFLKRLWTKAPIETKAAVADLSFTIQPGERVAFIGPNGAGKSTTLRMLCGILRPSSGTATVAGLIPWESRQKLCYHIGVVFGQKGQLWPELTVAQGYGLLRDLYNAPPLSEDLLERFRLKPFWNQTVRTLSLGQRMRAEIVASLIHRPQILLLDEPSIGLDVTAKAELRDLIRQLSQEKNLTLLLTSHDTGDIEEMCDRVMIIDHGRLVDDTTINQLKKNHVKEKYITVTTDEEEPQFTFPGVTIERPGRHQLVLTLHTDVTRSEEVIPKLMTTCQVKDIIVEDPPLERIIRHIYATTAAAGMETKG